MLGSNHVTFKRYTYRSRKSIETIRNSTRLWSSISTHKFKQQLSTSSSPSKHIFSVSDLHLQLAAIALKKYVKEHWSEHEEGFIPPVVNDEDKVKIKQLLPAGLADPESRIRTSIVSTPAIDLYSTFLLLLECVFLFRQTTLYKLQQIITQII